MSIENALSTSLDITLDAQTKVIGKDPYAHALTSSRAQGLPSIAVAPAQGAQLSILCQLLQAKKILEIGTLGGYSTLWFANSVPGVQVTSIEFDPKHREVAMENTKSCNNVNIILGAAMDILPTLQDKGPFDFVFIDADWDHSVEYWDWAVKLTRKGGCIYNDNVIRQLTEDGGVQGRKLIEKVKGDERVNATLIPMLATHKGGRQYGPTEIVDGYLLAVVK